MSPWRTLRSWIATPRAKRAVEARDLVALRSALAKGANPNAIVSLERQGTRLVSTFLIHRATELRWPDGIQALVQAGANVEARGTVADATPLFLALEARHPATVRALAQAGASLDGEGWTIDRAHMAQCEQLLSWDYPNQIDWMRPMETTCRALLEEFRNDTELVSAFFDGQVQKHPSTRPPRPIRAL